MEAASAVADKGLPPIAALEKKVDGTEGGGGSPSGDDRGFTAGGDP